MGLIIPCRMKDASLMGPTRDLGVVNTGIVVFHSSMRRFHCLPTLEVKSESTREIGKFFKLFNRRLSEVSEKEGYRFNPKASHIHEAGANPVGVIW